MVGVVFDGKVWECEVKRPGYRAGGERGQAGEWFDGRGAGEEVCLILR